MPPQNSPRFGGGCGDLAQESVGPAREALQGFIDPEIPVNDRRLLLPAAMPIAAASVMGCRCASNDCTASDMGSDQARESLPGFICPEARTMPAPAMEDWATGCRILNSGPKGHRTK